MNFTVTPLKQIKCNLLFLVLLCIAELAGCKRLVEINAPVGQIISSEIYNSNNTAISVLNGIYSQMSNDGIFNGARSISVRVGLSADELISTASSTDILTIINTNSLSNNGDLLFWGDLYEYIFKVNAAIEGISNSNGISSVVKRQLIGEAKFIRAFMYFYLVNLYGDIPLLTSTDIKINSTAPRSDKQIVYEQILKDLIDSRGMLNENYVGVDLTTITTERIRPTKAAVSALLARVYLYTNQWKLAEEEATKVISNTSTYQLEELSSVFIKNSKESIWQLQPVAYDHNTEDALIFTLAEGPGSSPPAGPDGSSRPVYMDRQLFHLFEIGDARKAIWSDSVIVSGEMYPYPTKYKVWLNAEPVTEYLMVLRLGELYLIRAEARAELGNLYGTNSSSEDVNAIRNRAGLEPIDMIDKTELLISIQKERRVELFTEWGHRWFDLKRTGTIDDVMVKSAVLKGGIWNTYKSLFPIPVQDIQRNVNLRGHQNIGYPEL